MKKCTRDHQVQQILLSGLSGRKAPSSMDKISTAEVLRLRATSAVSRYKSVRRSAQDDDFVGVLTENILNELNPALTCWATLSRPYGTQFGESSSHADTKGPTLQRMSFFCNLLKR